jgi:predicted ATPase
LAKKGGVLIIDEPELNLHPNKQRQIAKLLIQLVNAGIKILITTHSDYLVREINNRIMLNNIPTKDSGKIMKEFKIDDSELLNIQQVRAFGIDDERKITSYTVDEYGIDTRIFDKVINEANILNDKIFYSLDAEK